jgi:hypothetical protein
VAELELLRLDHAPALLACERETLRAATTLDNNGSRAVLARTGFVPTGETVLSGRPGISYTLNLS